MSEARVFDTHENFKLLVEAGIPENQAEAIIKCQSASQTELATKSDLNVAIAQLESRLTNKMYAAMAVQATLIIALIKLLP